MIFDISPATLYLMMQEANGMGWPHFLEQVYPDTMSPLEFTWQVDGGESGYGNVEVQLHLNGTWAAKMTRSV